MNTADQSQFDFDANRSEDGYRNWQIQRRQAMRALARKLGLPLEREVEVWLRGEIRLEGVLRLREEKLFVPEAGEAELELIVDNVTFTPSEMVSCVAVD